MTLTRHGAALLCVVLPLAYLTPPGLRGIEDVRARIERDGRRASSRRSAELDAWTRGQPDGAAASTSATRCENSHHLGDAGWGNAAQSAKDFVESLARMGFKTVRLPVAWDTYA